MATHDESGMRQTPTKPHLCGRILIVKAPQRRPHTVTASLCSTRAKCKVHVVGENYFSQYSTRHAVRRILLTDCAGFRLSLDTAGAAAGCGLSPLDRPHLYVPVYFGRILPRTRYGLGRERRHPIVFTARENPQRGLM
eukprot:3027429-Prymnesium_polylepis.1